MCQHCQQDARFVGRRAKTFVSLLGTISNWLEEFRRSFDTANIPLVGPAQLHHCHWECVIYYTETIQSDYPFPTYIRKPPFLENLTSEPAPPQIRELIQLLADPTVRDWLDRRRVGDAAPGDVDHRDQPVVAVGQLARRDQYYLDVIEQR